MGTKSLWRGCLLAACCTLFTSAFAQDWAKSRLSESNRHQEWVEHKSGSRTVKSFVVYPEVKEKATVVILIHEIMGLSDWVMLLADQLAAEGFIVIAPDFLSGMAPNGGRTIDFPDAGSAREAVSGLSRAQVISDLDSAVSYATSIPAANGKVAVAGFCWGGTQAFNFATANEKIAASFVFYGSGTTDAAAIAKIKCPVYGSMVETTTGLMPRFQPAKN
ncbi:dienelactone hydrolase family protein [Kamptonema cortianum]|nr:dienelactone hydrolase family protein [Kamptonema cortianum]